MSNMNSYSANHFFPKFAVLLWLGPEPSNQNAQAARALGSFVYGLRYGFKGFGYPMMPVNTWRSDTGP